VERVYEDVKIHAAAEEGDVLFQACSTKTWGQDAARHSVSEPQELDVYLMKS